MVVMQRRHASFLAVRLSSGSREGGRYGCNPDEGRSALPCRGPARPPPAWARQPGRRSKQFEIARAAARLRPRPPAQTACLRFETGGFPLPSAGESALPMPSRELPALSAAWKVHRLMNQKIARFLSETSPETPCLVVDLDVIAAAYDLLARYLSIASIYHAVKANPAAEIVAMLADRGSRFDVASPAEIALCLANGATADRLSFGNTIKKEG